MTVQAPMTPHVRSEVALMSLAMTIRSLREENAQLLARIDEMLPDQTGLEAEFGLSRIYARILALLLARPGTVKSREAILAAMHYDKPECDYPDVSSIGPAIWRLRRQLDGRVVIANHIGIGYSARRVTP